MRSLKYKIMSNILPRRLLQFSVKTKMKALYLTFDDGPCKPTTEKLLTLLKENKIRATFFCIGKNIEQNPIIMQKLIEAEHKIGNHSYSHANYSRISYFAQKDEVKKTNQLIKKYINNDCVIFRPPGGVIRKRLTFLHYLKNLKNILWSYNSMDYTTKSPEEIIRQFKRQKVVPGDIILFHDDSHKAHDILITMIPYWKEQGFSFEVL